ncbi:MAG: hypothetical protein P8X55_12130 [Desulfosarcinaceae bacterium]
MKKKKYIVIMITAFFTVFAFSAPALAGSPQQHRWEGVAIGIGAVLLGKALFDASQRPYAAPAPQPAVVQYHHAPRPAPSGHWEIRKQWVAPVYKKVWNPGHYNRHGRWVTGQWLQVEVESGYWVEKQVWVPRF